VATAGLMAFSLARKEPSQVSYRVTYVVVRPHVVVSKNVSYDNSASGLDQTI